MTEPACVDFWLFALMCLFAGFGLGAFLSSLFIR